LISLALLLSVGLFAEPRERVLILPATTVSRPIKGRTIDNLRLAAFGEAFVETASEVFAWRRFLVVSADELRERSGDPRLCADGACALALGRAAGASQVVSTVLLLEPSGQSCSVQTTLLHVGSAEVRRRLEDRIRPCMSDQLLGAAEDLGRRIAEGPRLELDISLSLTPLSVPSIDIPDLPDVSLHRTSTQARAKSAYDLDSALEAYKHKHMFLFEDADGRRYVARDGKVLSDCDVFRAASLTVPPQLLEFCEGNNWELAWLALPLGAAITLAAVNDETSARPGSATPIALAIGVVTSVLSPVLALVLNVDAANTEAGDHYATPEELETIVKGSNQQLRKDYELTEADVTIAGMRL
jgi:hypothetical protein